jgi:hypothetical protein
MVGIAEIFSLKSRKKKSPECFVDARGQSTSSAAADLSLEWGLWVKNGGSRRKNRKNHAVS